MYHKGLLLSVGLNDFGSRHKVYHFITNLHLKPHTYLSFGALSFQYLLENSFYRVSMITTS